MRLHLLAPIGLVLAMVTAAPRPPAPVASAAAGPLRPPLAGAPVTQGFGCTTLDLEPVASGCPGGHFHSGIDYAAPLGTAVLAAAQGTARRGYDPHGYGLYVVLEHGGGLSTLYAHLSSSDLATGAPLATGARVGGVGSSGLSTGPHLHFEVRRDGRPVDPNPLLTGGN
jgi:murein DD-endopeptidase MepM/ murein hydrolase activator NlpD